MLCVGTHKDYQGRGIAKVLTRLLVQNSKNKGFYISKGDCMSLYSIKAFLSEGAKVEKSLKYAEF